ncbi:MAG: cytochrome C oxidase subunit IV family protein [Bacteroidetes bacterium]|nr:cytochrome C oxidase subunit IV family protein [Bacteroidota bacterium]MBS1608416.1 cytochrome C oxidase subunit IV family protein [Bacteroidota bacterium]
MSQHYDPTKDISPSAAYPEVTFGTHHDDQSFYSKVKKTTIVLSLITIGELILGLYIYYLHKGEPSHTWVLFLKGVICIATLAKAYYIVSVFMHLGDEIRNMIMTIVVPLMLFIWFIAAFLIDGNSYRDLRNKYDPYFKYRTTEEKAPVKQHEGAEEPEHKSGKE